MRGRDSLRSPVYVLEKSGGAAGILIGAQICACLILRKPSQELSALFSPSSHVRWMAQRRRCPRLAGCPGFSPLALRSPPRCDNTVPGVPAASAGPSQHPLMTSPLTLLATNIGSYSGPSFPVRSFTKQAGGHGIAVFTLHRSILFNPRDDVFSHELKIALPPPQRSHRPITLY